MKETSDSELKAVMKSGSDYANQQIKEKQAKMRDFIQQTGNKRDYFREQNYGKTVYNQSNIFKLTDFENKRTFTNQKFEKQFNEEIALIPKHLLDKVENNINNIFIRKGISGYSQKGKNIYLDIEPQKGDIIHEFAHAIEDAFNIRNSSQYKEILKKGLENYTNYDIIEETKKYERAFSISKMINL